MAKERSKIYPSHTITDVDYADAIALLANSPAQAKSCYIAWKEQQVAEVSM